MAEQTSDAPIPEEVQTPEVEEQNIEDTSQDVSDDESLEDMDFSFDDEEETKEPEGKESQDEEPEETEEEPESEEEQQSEEHPEEEPEAQEQEEQKDDKGEQKRRNDEFARQRIAERQAKEKAKAEAQDKYLQQADDDRDLAFRQLQIDAYNNRVEANSNKLQNSVDRALATIDLFKEGSPEVKEALVAEVEAFERANVVYDRNGDPVQVKGDLYEHLTQKADSIRRLIEVGARQSAKNKQVTKTKTIPTPSRTPKQPKIDPDLAAFDEEAGRWEE